MRDIHLYGSLAEQFTPHLRLVALTPREALSGIQSNYPGFLPTVKPMAIKVAYGDLANPLEFEIEQLDTKLGDLPMHIIPIPEGSKSSAGKIILGVALLGIGLAGGFGFIGGAATFGAAAFGNGLGITWGFLATMGGGIVLSALASPQVSDLGSREPPDQRASYLYKGPTNTQEEGGPVPYLCCERIITGGKIISLGVDIEQLPLTQSSGGSPTGGVGGDTGTPIHPGPPPINDQPYSDGGA